MFGTCVKVHIIDEEEDYKDIGLHGFDYKLFCEEGGGGKKQGLDWYSYLKHLIKLRPGYWVKHMSKINEANGMKNILSVLSKGKSY